jgi:DNA-binding transcriptional regulator YdaS (Cro superfamily)
MKSFLSTHSETEVQDLAEKVGSKVVYFKQIASGFRRPSKILSMSIEMVSGGKFTAAELRPDLLSVEYAAEDQSEMDLLRDPDPWIDRAKETVH